MSMTRRGLLLGSLALLAGCSATGRKDSTNYAARPDETHPMPAMKLDKIKPEIRRTEVAYETTQKPGTIVVDTPARRLYYVLGDGKAIRYAISVGKEGRELRGNAYVGRKAEWPSWTPTANMIRRDPEKNRKYAGGMKGGLNNPLGARALYLYRGGGDTNFRIHGTNQPSSIGYAMSSGCIRMLNHEVSELYGKVRIGAKVVVM